MQKRLSLRGRALFLQKSSLGNGSGRTSAGRGEYYLQRAMRNSTYKEGFYDPQI